MKDVKKTYKLVYGSPGSKCCRCRTDTGGSRIIEEAWWYRSGAVGVVRYCWQCITDYDAMVLMREVTKGWLKIVVKDGQPQLVLGDRPDMIFGYGRG